MNRVQVFCPNTECYAKGQTDKGNIVVHSRAEQRYRCTECGQTFSTTKGTLFYRLKTDPQIVMQVITLLAHGCPVAAIVAAFELDERTVKRWWDRAGKHCQAVHEHVVGHASPAGSCHRPRQSRPK